jgi:hypothetical protein
VHLIPSQIYDDFQPQLRQGDRIRGQRVGGFRQQVSRVNFNAPEFAEFGRLVFEQLRETGDIGTHIKEIVGQILRHRKRHVQFSRS